MLRTTMGRRNNEAKTKLCGYEIGKLQDGGFHYLNLPTSKTFWKNKVRLAMKKSLHQRSPLGRETTLKPLKQAQTVTGELQCVQSRTRPDLGYTL